MRRRILAAYGEASAADQAAGLEWYRRAYDAAATLLPDDPTRAAGVIAALSPRCHWRTNVAWAGALIEAAERGDASPPNVHTRAMRAQAWRIARGEAPLDVLGGPKVRAFFANITGDLSAVTVDTWAARVALGDYTPHPTKAGQYAVTPSLSGRLYHLIARAYREAAAILNLPARDVQAAVWVHVRGAAE
jgi:hypothetical protein